MWPPTVCFDCGNDCDRASGTWDLWTADGHVSELNLVVAVESACVCVLDVSTEVCWPAPTLDMWVLLSQMQHLHT